MIISLKKLAEWARFLTLFVILTMIFYLGIAMVTQWVQPSHRYGEPKGRAVKVFAPSQPEDKGQGTMDLKERLKLFYWLGE